MPIQRKPKVEEIEAILKDGKNQYWDEKLKAIKEGEKRREEHKNAITMNEV